jgi:hypothetical protein
MTLLRPEFLTAIDMSRPNRDILYAGLTLRMAGAPGIFIDLRMYFYPSISGTKVVHKQARHFATFPRRRGTNHMQEGPPRVYLSSSPTLISTTYSTGNHPTVLRRLRHEPSGINHCFTNRSAAPLVLEPILNTAASSTPTSVIR